MDDQQQQHDPIDRACQSMGLPLLLERGRHLTIVTENGTRYRIIAASDRDLAVLDDIEATPDDHQQQREAETAAGDPQGFIEPARRAELHLELIEQTLRHPETLIRRPRPQRRPV